MLEVESAALSVLRSLTRQWSPAPTGEDALRDEAELGLMQFGLLEAAAEFVVIADDVERMTFNCTMSGRVRPEDFQLAAFSAAPAAWKDGTTLKRELKIRGPNVTRLRRTHAGDLALAACDEGSLIEHMRSKGAPKARLFVIDTTKPEKLAPDATEPPVTAPAAQPAAAQSVTSDALEVLMNQLATFGPAETNKIMEIANGKLRSDEKMRRICAIDSVYFQHDSKQWAKLLNVSDAAIRQTVFWKVDRKTFVAQARELFQADNPGNDLPPWMT